MLPWQIYCLSRTHLNGSLHSNNQTTLSLHNVLYYPKLFGLLPWARTLPVRTDSMRLNIPHYLPPLYQNPDLTFSRPLPVYRPGLCLPPGPTLPAYRFCLLPGLTSVHIMQLHHTRWYLLVHLLPHGFWLCTCWGTRSSPFSDTCTSYSIIGTSYNSCLQVGKGYI